MRVRDRTSQTEPSTAPMRSDWRKSGLALASSFATSTGSSSPSGFGGAGLFLGWSPFSSTSPSPICSNAISIDLPVGAVELVKAFLYGVCAPSHDFFAGLRQSLPRRVFLKQDVLRLRKAEVAGVHVELH